MCIMILFSIFWYLLLILHFFIKLFYIFLKFYLLPAKSEIPTTLTVTHNYLRLKGQYDKIFKCAVRKNIHLSLWHTTYVHEVDA
jgi:hypothetical protein